MERRGFTELLLGGVIGVAVGYYVRMQRLLGIRFGSEEASSQPAPATETEPTATESSESSTSGDRFSFEQAAPGDRPAEPWEVVNDPTSDGFNSVEVAGSHATDGSQTLHLTGNGELDRILVGFEAELTDVETVRCDVYIERANVSWGEIFFGRWLGGESDKRIGFLGQTGDGNNRFDATGEFTDLEGDFADLTGTHELVFNMRGDNEAYFDNLRFYDGDGELLPASQIVA